VIAGFRINQSEFASSLHCSHGGLRVAQMRSISASVSSRGADHALDPVCGMTVDPAKAAGHLEHKGRTYHFCSKHCLHAFSADPEK